MKQRTDKGFALMMVMGITILLMILGATTAYLVYKAQQMNAGQVRYTTALIASDAAQDLAAVKINSQVAAGDTVTDTTLTVGSYQVAIDFSMLSTSLLSGNSSEMAAAYEGIGTGAGSRGAANYYRVQTAAQKTTPNNFEVSRLVALRRKLVGE
ncbi:MAG TPA: hypothetical protein VMF29_02250 [Candidatus Edwardsbacteria bacterium]|nr:hypothetical protein [Candidatus Edwardsbacteria bacterium]